MPNKKSVMQTCVLSKWPVLLFVVLAGCLIFLWGQRSSEARQGSVIRRQLPAQRENFDSRTGHQRTLTAPPESSRATAVAGTPQEAAQSQNAQAPRLKSERPSVKMRWSSLSGTPSRLYSYTETLSDPASSDAGVVARGFLKKNDDLFHLTTAEVDGLSEARRYRTEHNGVTHLTLRQQVSGIEVFQSEMTTHLDRQGAIIAVSGELIPGAASAANLKQPAITAVDALLKAAEQAGAEIREQPKLVQAPGGADARQEFAAGQNFGRDVKARLVYFPLASDQVRLAWEFVIWMRETPDVYMMLMDAERNTLLYRYNLTCYDENPLRPHGLVYTQDSPRPDVPHTNNAPPVVDRQDLPFHAAPFNSSTGFQSSDPHYDWWSGNPANGLISNNTDVRLDRDASPNQPDLPRLAVPDGNFSFPVDLASDPTAAANPQAAQINLFYWINRYHDILYSFGFNEASGNFQTNNFGLGGTGNDAVIGDAQDGAGTNNANFSTPPDGQPGRVQMFLWTRATPRLDGSFDQGVIIHELTHGLSNRLVGNGRGLGAFQSGSMGEGWSDYFGLTLMRREQDDPHASYPVGQYVVNNYNVGIRRYPYSTDMKVNPLTFKNLGDFVEVHAGGEIWCATLWELRTLLIERYGFQEGQRLSLQLVVDGLKLTPTLPSFVDARDAILLADRVDNQGANRCLIWKAFSKRGLGFYASTFDASDASTVESLETAPFCNATATLRLDKSSYVDNEAVYITLADSNAVAPVMVDVTSSRTGDRERIQLQADPTTSGLFSGSIRLGDGRANEGDGRLQGSDNSRDLIGIAYLDGATEEGSSKNVTASAALTRELMILDDDVERGNQSWLTSGSWAVTSDLSGSPRHSWRIRTSGNDPVLAQDLTLTSPLLDLTGLAEVTLSFSHSYQLIRGSTSGRIEVSVNDGATWTAIKAFTDNQPSFVPALLTLRGLEGQARARLRFVLVSPGIITTQGFWAIDDIRLTARSADPLVIPPGDAPEPIITTISPAFGPPSGGTQVMISGVNFTDSADTSVTFDGVPAAQLMVLGSHTISAVTPAHGAGPVAVRVTNYRGTAGQLRGFTYYQPGGPTRLPVLGDIFPVSGSVRGGTTVTITGTNFTPETAVLFGANTASVTFINGNMLRAVTPAGSVTGVVGVTVRNGDQQVTRNRAFNYVAATPPTVQILSPQGGEKFFTGGLIPIRWQSSDNRELIRQRISITYLPSVGLPIEQTIDIAPELGRESRSFNWAVPSTLLAATTARIRVTAVDDEGAETTVASEQFAIARRWESMGRQLLSIPQGVYAADGKYIYGIGRVSMLGAPTADKIVRYDTETNTWLDQGLATPPAILGNHRAVSLNGKIYIPGGTIAIPTAPGIEITPRHLVYDIASNTWSTQADVPSATALYALAADSERGVYYHVGGITLTTSPALAKKYDPATNTWTDLPPISMPRIYHGAAVIEGKLYVAGGDSPAGTLANGEVFDFETGKWSPIAPPIRPRLNAQTAVLKDAAGNPYWLFVGGLSDALNSADVYDVHNNRWIQLDNSFSLIPPLLIPGGISIPPALGGSGLVGGYFYVLSPPTDVSRLAVIPLNLASPDRAPVLTVPAAQFGAANSPVSFKVTASDLGSGVPVTITAEGLPDRARFTTKTVTNNMTEGTFSWTPTAADIGRAFDISFTASDGQLSDTKQVTLRVVSFTRLDLANARGSRTGQLAVESIVTASGSNLAAETSAAESEQLPFDLAGTTVTVDGAPAQIFSVSPDRVNFLLPATVEPGTSTIVIRSPGGNYAIGTAEIVKAAPVIFSSDAAGGRNTATLDMEGKEGHRTGVRLSHFEMPVSIRPGLLTLYGTGIRRANATNPNDENGVAESVQVTVGGQPARVVYAGAEGGLRGLDRIVIEIPASLAGGDRRVEVVVTVDGVAANRTTILIR